MSDMGENRNRSISMPTMIFTWKLTTNTFICGMIRMRMPTAVSATSSIPTTGRAN